MFFGPWTWLILTENIQKTPYLHVKHKNTCKTDTTKIHFFSDRQNIENTSKLGWVHLADFHFFRVPEPSLKRPYGHILVWLKGDQMYYIYHYFILYLPIYHISYFSYVLYLYFTKNCLLPFLSLEKKNDSTEITEIDWRRNRYWNLLKFQ